MKKAEIKSVQLSPSILNLACGLTPTLLLLLPLFQQLYDSLLHALRCLAVRKVFAQRIALERDTLDLLFLLRHDGTHDGGIQFAALRKLLQPLCL